MTTPVRERAGPGTPLRGVVVGTLIAGSVLLGIALHTRRGTHTFYGLSALLALVWLVGALAAGGVPRPRLSRHSLIAGAAVGALAWVVFLVGDLIFREVPWLHHQIVSVVGRADVGSRLLVIAIAVVNGMAEEAFFRGSVFTALSARAPVLRTTAVYVVVTACAANVTLIVASLLMGALWAVQRRVTHGVVASAVTHVVWSVLIITALPR
ncbi:MAG TPA: CPBP family glutamic-type intramembrane protease [Mycobacteriales bacterium]|nr:CPBP family glutamic-type intramembrane protease [Mycobacteriales bacterium]